MVFFMMISWLPDILISNGLSAHAAGWMLSLMQLAFIPFSFVTPVIAEKLKNQKWLTAMTGILIMLGAGGLVTGSSILTPIAVICIGGACGAAFSLSMIFFSLRSQDGLQASKLSGMAQSFGYFIAATGPVLLGFIHDMSGNWAFPIASIGLVGIILIVTGMKSGADDKLAGAGF
jgi:CP family cyanate transporter-like MFS transporter